MSQDLGKQLQYVTFTLNKEKYGINVLQVQEVLREVEVSPVPGAPVFILGIINLRGNVVSVIDARTRFGIAAKESDDKTRIIVINLQQMMIGILVDSVAEVMNIKPGEIEAAPNAGQSTTSKYIQGLVSKDDTILILVDLDKLINFDTRSDKFAR
ncbi:MAG: purine-binding chemotaxis protein CheW [Gammaproteobacteria bacterium]|nr:purine-binding chemotaxis protein CheW [Gammaproteobacteria bacterium]